MVCHWIMPITKAILLLVVVFFVSFTVSKTESKGLKIFGKVLAVVLLILSISLIGKTLCKSMIGDQCLMEHKGKMCGKHGMEMPHQQMMKNAK